MAPKISVHITQNAEGLYSATIAEFPGVGANNARDLDELRFALEQAIAQSTNAATGELVGPVHLPPLVPGQVTSLSS